MINKVIMGWSNPNFPVFQAALSFNPGEGDEKGKESDIVAVRNDTVIGFGSKALHQYLWILIQGLEQGDMANLQSPVFTGVSDTDDSGLVGVRKYRYNIPISKILDRFPDFDLTKARDKGVVYQPFFDFTDNFIMTSKSTAFEIRGFIFDNNIGTFL